MKFSCKKCRAQYAIADDKIRGKVIKVRCKRCQQLIVVKEPQTDSVDAPPAADDGGMLQDASLELEFENAFRDLYRSGLGQAPQKAPAVPPSAPPLEPPAGVEEPVWFFGLDGSEEGPFTLVEMEEHLRQGRLTAEHFAWRDGMEDWKPLPEIPELAQLMPRPSHAGSADARRRALEVEREEAFRTRARARRKAAPEEESGTEKEDRRRREEEDRRRREEEDRRRREEEDRRRREEEDRRRREEEDRRRREEEDRRRREAEERERRKKKDESRIAEHFFSRGESLPEADAMLPPPPVVDAEEAARLLQQESLAEEEAAEGGTNNAASGTSPLAREISEVIVRQAGVAPKGRRLGVALLLIFGILGLAGGMVALAFSQGWFTPPSTSHAATPSGEKGSAAGDVSLSEEEARKLRAQIWDVKQPARAQRPAEPGGGNRAAEPSDAPGASGPVLSQREKELLAFYQQQDQSRSEASPRIPTAGLIGPADIQPDLPSSSPIAPGAGTVAAKGPEAQPVAPAAAPGGQRLSEEQIRSVIQLHYRQVKNCLERQLKRDASLTGMLQVVARVQPDGSVQSAAVATPRFKGSVLESCLVKTVRRWRFPAFSGEAYELTFPLLLSAQQDY